MAEDVYQAELKVSFLERLDAIEAFLSEADAAFALDDLLAELRTTVIPNLAQFPRIGRRYLDNLRNRKKRWHNLPLCRKARPTICANTCHGDHLMLYAAVEVNATVYLVSIRHHRQLSFDFVRLWPAPT